MPNFMLVDQSSRFTPFDALTAWTMDIFQTCLILLEKMAICLPDYPNQESVQGHMLW